MTDRDAREETKLQIRKAIARVERQRELYRDFVEQQAAWRRSHERESWLLRLFRRLFR